MSIITKLEAWPLLEKINAILDNIGKDARHRTLSGFTDKPKGTQQSSDIPSINCEWVDQHTGPCGDDFYGQIYIELTEGVYGVFDYAC